tara:strand:- start:261 stop:1238 length:978 start_codon:yes stop_codon:yes gene_type:complete
MKYWWVNQNQTYRQEVSGGYMWSPKLNSAGNHNRAYSLMRIINPGDIVFSFADTKIKAIGVVQSNCYEFPKPATFGMAGQNWSDAGWRLDVAYTEIQNPIRPKDHIDTLIPILPDKYSPLQPSTGNGNQTFYLYDISNELAFTLAGLMDQLTLDIVKGNFVSEPLFLDVPDKASENISLWEDQVEEEIASNAAIADTEKDALIRSRRGQGRFRKELYKIESACRITGVTQSQHLIASHTKPWRDCTNEERLDPENGFMLTPTIDHLFDRGFIGFENNGDLLISPVAHQKALAKMGLPVDGILNVGTFSQGQKAYLDWHRESLLLK